MPSPVQRYLAAPLKKYLRDKILLITGPRQAGKTTLTKTLGPSFDYLNYDNLEHQKNILQQSWDRQKTYVILDELHKKKNWKLWLKGIYDTEEDGPGMIVTGSARLDTFRKMGDSLAGRFFHFRLHPFDLKEVVQLKLCDPKEGLAQLELYSGFPEPFLRTEKTFYGMWKKTHSDLILRQDIFNFGAIKSVASMETLIQLLRVRVGSPLSHASLATDLHCAPKTVKHWLSIMENLYVVFKILPWHKNIARSLLKAPKYYFYDVVQVRDSAARLENIVACALLKEIHFRQDTKGEEWDLFYLRNKDKKEVDFLITCQSEPTCLVEVKSSRQHPSEGIRLFARQFPEIPKIQLVQNLQRESTLPGGVEIRRAADWLAKMDF